MVKEEEREKRRGKFNKEGYGRNVEESDEDVKELGKSDIRYQEGIVKRK